MTSIAKKVAVAAAWIVGGGGLVAAAFVFSFIAAMRLSMQSNEVAVPDLSGVEIDAVAKKLQTVGLVAQVVDRRNDPGVQSGRVIEQIPPSGSRVRRGRKIKLIVSLGGRVVEVPDIVGQASRASAMALLHQGLLAGDEAHVSDWTIEPGRVLAQVPAAAASTVPNTRVHRLVSAGAPRPAWVMPDLRGRSRSRSERWVETSGFRLGPVRRVRGSGRLPGTVIAQYPLSGYPIRQRDIVELAVAE